MDATEVAAVLARARQGDSEAFRTLVERHGRRAFQLAYRMTGNEQDAEDVVQESFIRAYRQLGRFEARAHFSTWLHRIVANCAVDLIRSRRSRFDHASADTLEAAQQPDSDTPNPERLAASAQIQRTVAAAMGDLSPLERAAFTLRHYEGRSIAEIGKTLGLGTSATKHSVFRAVRKLRAALEPLRGES
ncbi:MAG TPA: sigma-70 family RNA polymerase sigma factor [Vicinamibacterales bacterium]|nr:sigma-70 family RNA polymerase sigma factor [Vicinamibacterales bacterium]